MIVQVEPVKLDDQFYVGVTIGGHEMEPRGPYHNRAEAEAMARRLLQFGRALTSSSGGKHG